MGSTLLHLAAEKGHLIICKVIMLNCQDINPKEYGGIIPLHEASLYGHFEEFKLIATSVEDIKPGTHHFILVLQMDILKYVRTS